MAANRQAVAALVRPWALSACETAGCTLWDVEYLREGGENYLRVTIDKPEGVGISDCEAVSRLLNDILDTEDPIDESYSFQVSSPGVERELKRPEHFDRYLGKKIRLRLYKAFDGAKEQIGVLEKADENEIVLVPDGGEPVSFPRGNVAKAKAYFDFDFGGL
ncbi:MAG: ribosome maturation factor RimP [Clostridia bacterium]|nr:ribosome maturation factor RimP [Clostridia bacterium]